MNTQPFVSVVTPVYNGSKYLGKCLDAVSASSYRSFEMIVVDDGSTDNSAEIARKKGATVLQLPQQSGPATARNYAAKKARGDILFFVDADVLVQKGTIARMVKDFNENPDIAAVFGSYDDKPAEENFLSQYKNLSHHFVHQQSDKEAVTFWAGCGAIRKEVFYKMGARHGYDQKRYPEPSVEDIELA
jgi:glycosyltransferase involved in cell wall biosynthesis